MFKVAPVVFGPVSDDPTVLQLPHVRALLGVISGELKVCLLHCKPRL